MVALALGMITATLIAFAVSDFGKGITELAVNEFADLRDHAEAAIYNSLVAPDIPEDYYVEIVNGDCFHVEFVVPYNSMLPTLYVEQRVTKAYGGSQGTIAPCGEFRDEGKLVVRTTNDVVQPAFFRTSN